MQLLQQSKIHQDNFLQVDDPAKASHYRDNSGDLHPIADASFTENVGDEVLDIPAMNFVKAGGGTLQADLINDETLSLPEMKFPGKANYAGQGDAAPSTDQGVLDIPQMHFRKVGK
jgi:hypothetical protein